MYVSSSKYSSAVVSLSACRREQLVVLTPCRHPTSSCALFGQFPSSYNGAKRAEVPVYLEEDLIRLVLAEQLEGISANIKKEDR